MMNPEVYRDKVRGCWLGKGIGGNLGMPYEGCPNRLELTLNDLSSKAVPNDDLELQLLWIRELEEQGAGIRAEHMAKASLTYLCYPDEYGVSKWNIERGILPPLSGRHNNVFADGMGAAIRSEIWACLFPGNPTMAAMYAREDAIIDHHGNGVWAEQFLAAAESLAFDSSSAEQALEGGLQCIPQDCRLARALRLVQSVHAEQLPWEQAYDAVMKQFRSPSFTDVSMNLAFIMLGLLYGDGDFEKSLLLAVNCGMDTDCTAATTGSFLGILLGEQGIPLEWREEAPQELALSDSLQGLGLPESLDEVTDRTLALSERINNELSSNSSQPFTPDSEDEHDDRNQWLIFQSSGDAGYELEPHVLKAFKHQPETMQQYIFNAREIHLQLDEHLKSRGDTLHMFSWFTAPEDMTAYLMVSAEAGITAWLDEKLILNYHGRRKPIPTFHRTEGGGTVPVELKAGQTYALRVRLIGCAPPLVLTVALGRENCSYLDGIHYQAKASTSHS